ncbi:MAG: FAD-dependent oxidoreductase [Elusimicrobiota bacterium]|nr:FAD-dependent oxidoreductase [Elusimicrobiota bacterium]
MEKTDGLVIGGSAAGIIAAVTGKASYPDKKFLVIRKEKQVLVPCGIPYIFSSLESSDKDLIPDAVLSKAGVDLKIGEVVSMDTENKVCKTADGQEIGFEKLILALGSTPVVPKWLKGADLENVFTIPKNKVYLDEALTKLKDCKKVVIIGGGFIGVEISDELNKNDKDITLVEILPNILDLVFDKEVAIKAEEIIKSRGVKVESGSGVKELLGDKKVDGVLLNNGKKIEADAVVLAMGYRTNTNLAKEAGIETNDMGFIKTDKYMRTRNCDIFAVGDCASKRDFITGKVSGVMLASTACAEARIAGMNLYKLSSVQTFSGTIAVFATAFGEIGFASAGLIEKQAIKEGFDIVTSTFEGVDKHPGTLPGTHKQVVKLIASKDSGVILGGEIICGPSTGEAINILGFAIQNRMTVNSVLTTQIGTHPLLTAPPTAYPITKAAEMLVKKLKK